MTGFRLTPAAQRDLSAIWDYSEHSWDAQQAETYISEIRAAIERIADDPLRGRAREDVRAGCSSYSVVSHVVFYRERARGGGVDVIRILHQRMDPARHL